MLLGVKEPAPPDQIPVVVGPETVPDKTVSGLFLQVDRFTPALVIGALVYII